MGDEEWDYSYEAEPVEEEPERPRKKQVERTQAEVFGQKKLFQSADDVLRQSAEKSSLGLGGSQRLFGVRERVGSAGRENTGVPGIGGGSLFERRIN